MEPAAQDPIPLKFELLQAAEDNPYLLRAKGEIVYHLKAVAAEHALVAAHYGHGNDFLLTTLLAVDDGQLHLDVGKDPEVNRRLLAADRIVCVTHHDKVKVQFALRRLDTVSLQGRTAFRADLPDRMLRLQRREYYRLVTPAARPLRCHVPMPGGAPSIVATVLDISGGGLAVVVPPAGLDFSPDTVFRGCRIELPEVGTLIVDLRVKNLFEVTLRNGVEVMRSGCQFERMPGPMLTLVQRYILKVERERKARESGLA
ncbi:MAG TPA: flagellar brake protein [Rhodocyclaceae bacterium]|nr:flagellar brake protein [Rhodocyclaceae bacterium]HNH35655.1 flagellar brake protein [Rhodocyclaceae bacterium]